MSFPQVLSVTETPKTSFATSFNVDMPATVNSGELLLLIATFSDGNFGVTPTVTDPSGWTRRTYTTSNSACCYIALRESDGSEGGTTVDVVTNLSTKGCAQVYRISGWADTGTILNDVAVATLGTDDFNPPSLNPSTWGSEDTLWIAGCCCTFNPAGTTDTPDSYTDLVDTAVTSPSLQLHSMRRELNTASEDPTAFGHGNNNEGVVFTVAIRPSAATAAEFAAAISGSANCSAVLSTQITMQCSVSGAGNIAGNISTQINLQSSVSGIGNVTANLQTQIPLQSSVSGAANVAASIQTQITFQASISGSVSLASNLSTQIQFASGISCSASLIGELDQSWESMPSGEVSLSVSRTQNVNLKMDRSSSVLLGD